jgi:hypothetical protein
MSLLGRRPNGDQPETLRRRRPADLPPVDRAILAEALRAVSSIQRRMGNMALFVMPEMRRG